MPQRTSSKRQYDEFRAAFKQKRLDDLTVNEADGESTKRASPHKQSIRHYIAWLRPYKAAVFTVFVLSAFAAGADMLHPLFMRYLIDSVLLGSEWSDEQRFVVLNVVGALFLGVIVAGESVEALRMYRQRQLNVRVLLSLRRALHNRMLHLPLSRLSSMKTGGVVSRLSGDVDTTSGLLQMSVISPAVSLMRVLMAIGILFVLNWKLALTAIAIIPGIAAASFVMARRVRPIYRAIREDAAQVDGRLTEAFGGIRAVRAFGRESLEHQSYSIGHNTIARKELFAHRREIVIWVGWGFLLSTVSLVIVWFGGFLQMKGSATIGDIMAFQWYVLMLLNPVWRIVESFSDLQRSLAAMDRVFEVLSFEEDKPDLPDAIDTPKQVDQIRFEQVNFEYRTGQPVIRDFSLTVPGGSVVALVGRSGAGKTTITDLVARFHDPTEGALLLNGTDLRQIRLKSYRSLLGVVQQEVFLFDGTVHENIVYADRHASHERVMDAARRANAHEFIAELPDGYDTIIGERGVKLSGGQRQRISIARAILADPQILILDEATSNLDTESERLIQESLKVLLTDRTTFVIAHRLSTVTHADLIVVMERGEIVEVGTHEQLMKTEGQYRAMVRRQSAALSELGLTAD